MIGARVMLMKCDQPTRVWPATLLFAIIGASGVLADDRPVLTEDAEPKVYVAWDDNRILSEEASPATRDALSLALVTATSKLREPADWPEVKITSATDARTLVDRYFDYYPDAFPKTTDFLVRQIKKVNGEKLLQGNTMIKIPPVPVKPRENWDLPATNIRTFSPDTSQYEAKQSIDSLNIPDGPRRRPLTAVNLSGSRSRGTTAVVFNSLSEFRQAFTPDVRKKLGRSLYVWVGPADDQGTSTFPLLPVDLYDEPVPCTITTPPLTASGYHETWNARRATLSDTELTALAKADPLVLVDWDFDGGHGRKVYEVVELALRHFGVWDAVGGHVEKFELNPRVSEVKLRNALTAYRATVPEAVRPELDISDDWIKTYKPLTGNRQNIDQGILQAVTWEHFSHRQTWVNMSFSIRAKNVDYDAALINSSAYSFVAAGNKLDRLPPYYFPQNMAQDYVGRAINITYGDRDGIVRGTFASIGNDYKTSVGLVAQGSNFKGCLITPSEKGSSFASPWVAAAAWLKHLIDKVPSVEMRSVLIGASTPLPSLSQPVDSGGYFDPDLLLAFPGKFPPPHAVHADGSIERITGGTFTYRAVAKDGEVFTNPEIDWSQASKYAVTLAKCPETPETVCLWARKNPDGPHWPLKVSVFNLVIKKAEGDVSITKETFLNDYRSIHF